MRVFALLILSLCACSCTREVKTDARSPARAIAAVARAQREDLAREMEISAEFRPYQEVELHAKVAGYLKTISVDAGHRVSAGQAIATLEIPELGDDMAYALAAKRGHEAEVVRARSELNRSESAHEMNHLSQTRLTQVIKSRPNLVAQQEIDEAMSRDRISEAQLATARAALAVAEQQVQVAEASQKKVSTLIDYSRIVAPFSGVITKRYVDPGAMIQAGTAASAIPIVRLSQVDRLRLVLPIPESSVPRLRTGARIEVRVPALDRSFNGKVARLSGRVATATRTMDIEVDVENPRGELVPGMYANAMLTLESRERALSIPVQAIVSHDPKPHVFVVTGQGKVEDRVVRLGLETPDRVEVLSGLTQGELVIIGARQIKPGDIVETKLIQLTRRGGVE